MVYYSEDYLCHHGIRGQKWGVRRFQNRDGSLTPEGRRHYKNQGSYFPRHGKTKKQKRREEYEKAYNSYKFKEEAEAVKNRYGVKGMKQVAKGLRKGKTIEQGINKIERGRQLSNLGTYFGNALLIAATGGNAIGAIGGIVRASINTVNAMKVNKGKEFVRNIRYETKKTAKEAKKYNEALGYRIW